MAAVAVLTRTQEERTEAAKERIRCAALSLFAKNGYDATSLAAISVEAGFSRTLAQYHYTDKADLAVELLEERIRRDNHLDLLECAGDDPCVAWDCIINHLDAVSTYYGNLHGSSEISRLVRGEMALHTAALMGYDAVLTRRVNTLTVDLIDRFERLFEICRKAGFIAQTSNAHALAILHVHSVWGLAQALFASPRGGKAIGEAFLQMREMLEALRTPQNN